MMLLFFKNTFFFVFSKLTYPHLSMNNIFPPINAHSRPPSEDLRGVGTNGTTEIHSASKQQQLRRQHQTIDQQRRSPLRSNSLLQSTASRYVTAAAAAAAVVSSPSVTISPLVRSPSFVQTGSSAQFEPPKSEQDRTNRSTFSLTHINHYSWSLFFYFLIKMKKACL